MDVMDSSSGILSPYYDHDTRIVFLAGKVGLWLKCTPHTTVILRWPNTVPAQSAECGEAFVDFIAASKVWNDCATVILVGHNSSSFDAPVLLRTLLRYSPQLIPKEELNFHFAQSCFYLKAHQRKMSSVENTG